MTSPIRQWNQQRKLREKAKAKARRRKVVSPVERYYKTVWCNNLPERDFAVVVRDMESRGIDWHKYRSDVQWFFIGLENFDTLFGTQPDMVWDSKNLCMIEP